MSSYQTPECRRAGRSSRHPAIQFRSRALAAWCHGLRAGHHFTTHPQRERDAALSLAEIVDG